MSKVSTYLSIQKPGSRTILLSDHYSTVIQHSFFLNFPYIVFYGVKGTRYLFVGCCDEKPNLNSHIYCLPLSNVYGTGRVCLSDADDSDLDDQINYFWSSRFDISRSWNADLMLSYLFDTPILLDCFEKWQATKPSSLFNDFNHGTLLQFMNQCDEFIMERQYWEMIRPEMNFE